MNKTWKPVSSVVLPNLNVLEIDGREVGFIQKPRDSRGDKNLWRCYKGIGDAAVFLGHHMGKKEAKTAVENSVK